MTTLVLGCTCADPFAYPESTPRSLIASIEELIAVVGISKSGFFYHFRDKAELAKALLLRYLSEEDKIFDSIAASATSRICNRVLTGF